MAITLNADTSTGLEMTSDTSGEIKLQSAGADIATVDSSGITMASGKTLPAASLTGTLPAIDGSALTNLPPALNSGTVVASTSGTSIDFTSIPSGTKRITVMFDGVSTNGTSDLLIQIGDSGGVETSGYATQSHYASTGVTLTTSTAGFFIYGAAQTFTYHGQMIISLVDSSTNTWVETAHVENYAGGWGAWSAGKKSLSGTLDRVRITTVGGSNTFDAGNINILYE
jgi:hypothetical protein